MQADEITTQSRFAVRNDLAAVHVDGEAGLGGVVVDADNAAAVLKEVLEDGEVGSVVDLAPSLVWKVVVLEGLKSVDTDVEVGGVE